MKTSHIVVLNRSSVNCESGFVQELVLSLNVDAKTPDTDMMVALSQWPSPGRIEDFHEVGQDIPLDCGRMLRSVWVRCVEKGVVPPVEMTTEGQEMTIKYGTLAPVYLTFRYTKQSCENAMALYNELWTVIMDQQAVLGGE